MTSGRRACRCANSRFVDVVIQCLMEDSSYKEPSTNAKPPAEDSTMPATQTENHMLVCLATNIHSDLRRNALVVRVMFY